MYVIFTINLHDNIKIIILEYITNLYKVIYIIYNITIFYCYILIWPAITSVICIFLGLLNIIGINDTKSIQIYTSILKN